MTSSYINVKLNISEGQKQKIKSSLANNQPVSIRLTNENLEGSDVVALTQRQINKIAQAQQQNKGVTIKMSKTQVQHNMTVNGGLLPLLAGLASSILPAITGTVLPALATGALSSVASNLVGKLFNQNKSGSSLYLKRGNGCAKVKIMGDGLFLSPYKGKAFDSVGQGIYIKSGSGYSEASGLLLGPNSPLKDVPLIGWIL